MSERMRLDKLLAQMGIGTRSALKTMAKRGAIVVDGSKIKDVSQKVDPQQVEIYVDEQRVIYRPFIYLMLNKPAGVISATEDRHLPTVSDLLPEQYRHFAPFPVGRLDRDTEGLLLLTNDGPLAHDLLSPRKHVPKVYYARVSGLVDEADIAAFAAGVQLDDGYLTRPAVLAIQQLDSAHQQSEIILTITEGKFHQVKRMFLMRNKPVLYLKRLAMGGLLLDESLAFGECRELTEAELSLLRAGQQENG